MMFQILRVNLQEIGVNDAFSQEGEEYAIKLNRYWSETLAPKIQKYAFEFDPNEIANPAPSTAPIAEQKGTPKVKGTFFCRNEWMQLTGPAHGFPKFNVNKPALERSGYQVELALTDEKVW